MNRKGLTLVELLATLVALSLVLGIGAYSMISVVRHTKKRSEDAFANSIKDALDIYISSSSKPVTFGNSCNKQIKDASGNVLYTLKYEWEEKSFKDLIESKYKPIEKNDLINPTNKKACYAASDTDLSGIKMTIYRESRKNDDGTFTVMSYFYKVDKSHDGFNGCFDYLNTTTDASGNVVLVNDKTRYISNLKEPEKSDICS